MTKINPVINMSYQKTPALNLQKIKHENYLRLKNPKADSVNFTGAQNFTSKPFKAEIENFISYINPIYANLAKYTENAQKSGAQTDKDTIKNFLQKSDTPSYQVMGVGTNSICYKMKASDGKNYAIRFFKPDAKNYGNDSTYEKEAFALKKFRESGVKDSQELIDVFEKDGKHYIVTSLATGKPLNPAEGRILTPEQTKDVLKKLTLMDKSGFMQYDAQIENIFYDANTAKLIDFGGFTVSVQDKATLDELAQKGLRFDYNSFYPSFSSLKEGDIKKFNLENALKTTKPYLGFSDIDIFHISGNSNPHFSAFSNISNFEYRSLFYHLFDVANTKNPQTSMDILKAYLKEKGQEYHKSMAQYFDLLDVSEVSKACELDEATIAQRIKNAADYEKMMAKILTDENLSPEVLKTELAKLQIKWVANEQAQAAQTQFESLTSMIKGFRDNAADNMRQYFNDSLKFFDKIKIGIYEYLPKSNARQTLDSGFDVLGIFEKAGVFNTTQIASEAPKEAARQAENVVFRAPREAIETATSLAKKGSKNKITAAVVALIAAIGAAIAFFAGKNKAKINDMPQINTSAPKTLGTNTNVIVAAEKPITTQIKKQQENSILNKISTNSIQSFISSL